MSDGGLSSSTLSEATSWGKLKKTAERAMAWVEPTVALPIVVTAALQAGLQQGRPSYDLAWNGRILEKLALAERA